VYLPMNDGRVTRISNRVPARRTRSLAVALRAVPTVNSPRGCPYTAGATLPDTTFM
jgi:hypothetical protein